MFPQDHFLYTALDYLRERIPAGHRLTVDHSWEYEVFHELPED
jgi:hypothetical protein